MTLSDPTRVDSSGIAASYIEVYGWAHAPDDRRRANDLFTILAVSGQRIFYRDSGGDTSKTSRMNTYRP